MKRHDELQTIRQATTVQLLGEIKDLRHQTALTQQTRQQVARRLTVIREKELITDEK